MECLFSHKNNPKAFINVWSKYLIKIRKTWNIEYCLPSILNAKSSRRNMTSPVLISKMADSNCLENRPMITVCS